MCNFTYTKECTVSHLISLNITTPNRQLQYLNQFHYIVARLLKQIPTEILSRLSSFARSPNLAGQFTTIMPALELIVRQLNSPTSIRRCISQHYAGYLRI